MSEHHESDKNPSCGCEHGHDESPNKRAKPLSPPQDIPIGRQVFACGSMAGYFSGAWVGAEGG